MKTTNELTITQKPRSIIRGVEPTAENLAKEQEILIEVFRKVREEVEKKRGKKSREEAHRLPQFSFFDAPIKNTNPTSSINIEQLHNEVKNNSTIKSQSEFIRGMSIKKGQNDTKDEILPYITPSGTFSYRSNDTITQHSGYICADFDSVPLESLASLRTRLISDTELRPVLLFLSPRSVGYKVFYKIPAVVETHGTYFDAIENYFKINYELEIDGSCRDVSRPCYLSHDKDAHIDLSNIQAIDEAFLNKWLPAKVEREIKPSIINDVRIEQVNLLIQKLISTGTDLTTHYENWLKVGFALCELGEAGREPFMQISSMHPNYNADECDEKFTKLLEVYNGSTSLSSLFFLAKEHNVIVEDSAAYQLPQPHHESTFNDIAQANIEVMVSKEATTIINNNSNNSSRPRTAKQRLQDAKKLPDMYPLLGNIWQRGELDILFADAGTGKSVWATQIADALSKGNNVMSILPNQNGPLKVLFYDFELSDKQFQKRYTNDNGNLYNFSENLFIDNIDIQSLILANPNIKTDKLVIEKIIADIEDIKPQVLIIDNITCLKSETTQDAGVALSLIRELNNIKKKYGLSILVLAHTPKIKEGLPLTLNELAGSKQLSNFADSVSAIGKSATDPTLRYIKQIKVRSVENVYHAGNVIVAKMEKVDAFLSLNYQCCEAEKEHLAKVSQDDRAKVKQEKKEEVLRLRNEGKSFREIAEITFIKKSTVENWCNE